MNIGDLLSLIDSAKRRVGSTVQDVVANPKLGLLSMYDTANANAKDYNRRMMGLLGDTMSVVPQVSEQGIEGLLGEVGNVMPLAGTFAGVGAKTANKAALAKAQELAKQGADPVEVWKTTGWTDQFPDKKWRFEIPDNRADIVGKYPVTNLKEMPGGSVNTVGYPNADQFIAHPDLFGAYPDAAKIRTFPADKTSGASYLPATPPIRDFETIDFGSNMRDMGEVKSKYIHELQHAVQQREGFAKGGSPETAVKVPQQQADSLRVRARNLLGQGKRDEALALEKQARDLESVAAWSDLAPYEVYNRLAGEAEARLTQSRMNLTPAERAARPPWLEFDVPREQQIVHGLLGEDVGPQMAIKAYHGSPHKFDKFDISKINTGQGAQSYGQGLYTAENPKVAWSPEYMDPEGAYARVTSGMNNRQEFAHDLVTQDRPRADILKAMKQKYGQWVDDKTLEKELDQIIDARGNKYEVLMRWPDPAREAADPLGPQHFLDWDKPLPEQPEVVRKALENVGVKQPSKELIDEAAAQVLDAAKRNDHKAFGAAQRDWSLLAYPRKGSDIYREFTPDSRSTQVLRDAGIPGIRYLDAGSRGAGKGTANYVVFDDALLEILKRNGMSIK